MNRSLVNSQCDFKDMSRAFAKKLDLEDPLAKFRSRFFIPENTIYFDGNSLGLQSKDALDSMEHTIKDWRELAIDGWLCAETPWFSMSEQLGEQASALVGAAPDEVIATGTTTLNIHACVGALYKPSKNRYKILACADDFPTDIYALKSQILLKGLNPTDALVLVGSSNGEIISEEMIVSRMQSDVALALLPSVFFKTGQLLDMEYLCRKAKERGILIGFDCCHSAGAMPHELSKLGVDFAVWCSYKYLNAGPGSTAFLYLSKKHFGIEPSLAGWFGSDREKQFNLHLDFEPASSARRLQISSPVVLGLAAIRGALNITLEAGIEEIRKKSLQMTEYLMFLVDSLLPSDSNGFSIVSPRKPHSRGGHVAIVHRAESKRICDALRSRGIVTDFRPPAIIRIAPVALYNTFEEIWIAVKAIGDIIERREYESFSKQRSLIT